MGHSMCICTGQLAAGQQWHVSSRQLKWHVHNGELIALAQRTHSTKVEAAILDVYQLRSGQSPLYFQV